MSEYTDARVDTSSRAVERSHLSLPVLLLVALGAVLFQVYVPLFFEFLTFLELPLLVTVYFGLARRQAVSGLLYGAAIGLAQDSLSHQPLGMFGIAKTLVGYSAASLSQRLDADNPMLRLLLGFFFFLFHHFFYWLLTWLLLSQSLGFAFLQTLIAGLMNALVAVPLFHVLDRLRGRN